MAEVQELEFDRSVLGVEVEVGEHEVTREQIRAFCEAVGETNPLYVDDEAAAKGPFGGIIAPPVFYAVLPVRTMTLDPQLTFGNTQANAGQKCEFLAPVRPGDTISATGAITEVYEKTGRSGRMAFVVRRTTYTKQDGERVAVVHHSQVYRNV